MSSAILNLESTPGVLQLPCGRSQHPGIIETESQVAYGGVTLQKRQDPDHVPLRGRFEKHTITDYDMGFARDIAIGLALNQPVLVEAGSGHGKTSAIERMCAQLGWSCYYINCSKFDPEVMIGGLRPVPSSVSPSGFAWNDGVVLQSVRKGGVLLIDEYNYLKQTSHGRLHDILDAIIDKKGRIWVTENDGEGVDVHSMLRIVAIQNSPGTRASATRLDNANITRFTYITHGETLPESVWKARTLGTIGIETGSKFDARQNLVMREDPGHHDLAKIDGIESALVQFREFHRTVETLTNSGELGADQAQPVYFAYQRDLDRVLEFLRVFYNGDIIKTLHQAIEYYYVNRYNSDEDKNRVRELKDAITLSDDSDASRVSLVAPTPPPGRTQNSPRVGSVSGSQLLPAVLPQIEFYNLLRAVGVPVEDAIKALCGDGSKEANEIRETALLEGVNKDTVLYSLTGAVGEHANDLRKRCYDPASNSHLLLMSLAGGVEAPEWTSVDSLYQRILDEGNSNLPLFNKLAVGALGLIGRYDEQSTRARDLLKSKSLRRRKAARILYHLRESEMWEGQEEGNSDGLGLFMILGTLLGGIYPLIRSRLAIRGVNDRLNGILALSHAASNSSEAKAARDSLSHSARDDSSLKLPYETLALSLACLADSETQIVRDRVFTGVDSSSSSSHSDTDLIGASLIGVNTQHGEDQKLKSSTIGKSLSFLKIPYFEYGDDLNSHCDKRRNPTWIAEPKSELFGIYTNPITLALKYGAEQERIRASQV